MKKNNPLLWTSILMLVFNTPCLLVSNHYYLKKFYITGIFTSILNHGTNSPNSKGIHLFFQIQKKKYYPFKV